MKRKREAKSEVKGDVKTKVTKKENRYCPNQVTLGRERNKRVWPIRVALNLPPPTRGRKIKRKR